MKFTITSASEFLRPAGEKRIYTMMGLRRFIKKSFKDVKGTWTEDQEIILSFKRKRIIIYDDWVE